MAKKLNLDLSGVSAFGTRTVVPTGRYNVTVADVEMMETNAKNGWYLKVDFRIQGGEYDGSILVDRYNVKNPNEDAVRIGLSKIKAILKYGGAKNPDKLGEADDLIGLCLDLAVTEDPHSFEKDGKLIDTTQNNIQGFMEVAEYKEDTPKPQKQKEKTKSPEVTKPAAEKESEEEAFPWE